MGLVSVWSVVGTSMSSAIAEASRTRPSDPPRPAVGSAQHAAGLSSAIRALMHAADVSDFVDVTLRLTGRIEFIDSIESSLQLRLPTEFGFSRFEALSARITPPTPEVLDVFGFRATPWKHGEALAINRVGGTRNCSRCATALDATWNGQPRRARTLFDVYDLRDARQYLLARPGVVRRIAESLGYDSLVEDPSKIARTSRERVIRIAATHFMEITDDEAIAARVGLDVADFEQVSYRDLRSVLRTWPNRAKGVITIDRGGVGHAMNVIRHRGQTFVIDAQSNLQIRSFSADDIGILRTADVPEAVDLDAMGLTHAFDPY